MAYIRPVAAFFFFLALCVAGVSGHAESIDADSACLLQNAALTNVIVPMSSFTGDKVEVALPLYKPAGRGKGMERPELLVVEQGRARKMFEAKTPAENGHPAVAMTPAEDGHQAVAMMQMQHRKPGFKITPAEDGHQAVAMTQHGVVADEPSCPKMHALVPLTVLVTVLAFPMAWLAHTSANSDKAEVARSTGLFIQFCSLTSYSIVLVQAYDLSTALGRNAAFSGEFIGMYFGAVILGALTMAIALWSYPELWRMHPRHALFGVQVLNIAGCCIYTWSTAHTNHHTIHSPEYAHTLSIALLAARALSGFGQGLSGSLLQVTFAHVTPRENRPSQTMRFWFSITLGIGLGPVIAAAMSVFSICSPESPTPADLPSLTVFGSWALHRAPPSFELVGYAQFALAAASIASLVLFYPCLEDVQDFARVDASIVHVSTIFKKHEQVHRVIVGGCLVLTLARAVVTSGVEAGMAMLLETPYHFPKHDIGFMIGATFLFCWPVKIAIDCCRPNLHVVQVIRVLCVVSVLGSCLLLHRSWHCLVISAGFLFPSLYLSDGLIRGVMQQYAFPAGSYIDQTGTTFLAMIFNASGRFMGPWVARALLENFSQTGFAALQVLLTALFWLLFEFMIVAPVRESEKTVRPDSLADKT